MRLILGPLALLPVVALAVALAGSAPAATSAAATPAVTIYDNDAPSPASFDAAQGQWGFAPLHVEVKRGDPLVFHNSASNRYAHTVTSIVRPTNAYESTLTAGARFDSSPDANSRVNPGESWTLDTSGLDPGHYTYYCRPHLWMVGSFTVTP